MKKSWILLLISFSLFLAGCRSGGETVPTPFPTVTPTATAGSPSGNQPIMLALSDLAAAPEAYEGQTLQLTGKYRRLPRLICAGDPHPSPATWGLVADDVIAQASGFDARLRALLPDGLIVTAAGTWRQWRGPVGCGKRATVQEIWYLDTAEIISPSPLVRVTLTPSGETADLVAEQPVPETAAGTETPPGALQPTATAQQPAATAPPVTTAAPPTPQTTPTLSTTSSPAGSPTVAPQATESITATVAGGATATTAPDATTTATPDPNATPTPTSDPNVTPSPTPTDDPDATATPTPNPNATLQTPTPTSTPAETTIIEKDIIPGADAELFIDKLNANEAHSWLLEFDPLDYLSDEVTIIVPSNNVDITLAILDSSGETVVEQNQASATQIETIDEVSLPTADTYEILVGTANGAAAQYGLMVVAGELLDFFEFRGYLDYGASETTPLATETDHFWHFSGDQDETITISVTPNDDADLFLELYGFEGELLAEVDDEGSGDAEELTAFTLPEASLYLVRVGEFQYEAANYTIRVTNN